MGGCSSSDSTSASSPSSSSTEYKLVYFNAKGRAELMRLMFEVSGTKYTDERVEQKDWPKLKPTLTFGSMPVLYENGVEIPHSMAIARHLARQFSLYGSNNTEKVKIDAILDTVCDVLNALIKAAFEPDDEKKEALFKALVGEQLPLYLKFLDKEIASNSGKYAVGSKLSVADITIYAYLSPPIVKLGDKFDFTPFKNVMKIYKMVGELPQVKEWVAKRPVTEN